MKDPATRRSQLRDYISGPLAEVCAQRVGDLIVSQPGALVLFELIKAGRTEVLNAVCSVVDRSDTTPKETEDVEMKKDGEEEGELEYYYTSKPSSQLLCKLLRDEEINTDELLGKLVQSFGDNFMHWAEKNSNASYLIDAIVRQADKKTQQEV